jgi:ribosomal protein S18 acetylase RimI-like enzyme
MSVQYRRATIDDARIIAETHCASWLTTYPGLIAAETIIERTNVEKRVLGWESVMRDTVVDVWLAFDNQSACLGFCSFGPRKSQDVKTDGQFTALYLLQSAQRKGIGRKLVAIAMREMIARGYESACVEVLKDNPAEHFYIAMGAKRAYTGEFKEFGENIIEHTYVWHNLNVSLQAAVSTESQP